MRRWQAVILVFGVIACAHVVIPEPTWARTGTGAFNGPHPCFRGVGVDSHFHEDKARRWSAGVQARAALARTLDALTTALLKNHTPPLAAPRSPDDLSEQLHIFVADQFRQARFEVTGDDSTAYALDEIDLASFKAALLHWAQGDERQRGGFVHELDAAFRSIVLTESPPAPTARVPRPSHGESR